MTNMEAKARELSFEVYNQESEKWRRRSILEALTEAHREGMKKAAKVEADMSVVEAATPGVNYGWKKGQDALRAAIREKIK